MVRSPLQRSSPREKEKKGEDFHETCMGTLSCGRYLPIYKHLVCRLFIKIHIIMSIFANVYRPYVCDPLGSNISLVNNSIDSLTSY